MKKKTSRIFKDLFFIYIGTMVAAIGIDTFLIPSNLAPGGVIGISIVTNYLTNIPVSTLILALNIPLFLIGIKIFGRSYGLRTLAGITFLSFNTALLKKIVPHVDKLIDFTNSSNILLATLYGGLLMGIGVGTVIRSGGSTGGSDIISAIVNKYFRIPIGQALIIIDSMVILMAAFVFGAEKGLYALINLYVSGIVINKIINGLGNAKMVYIITTKVEEVRKIIVVDLVKTGNHYEAEGLYSRDKKGVITTVLRNREIYMFKELVAEADPEAFIVVADVHEVLGRGYTFDLNWNKDIRKEQK